MPISELLSLLVQKDLNHHSDWFMVPLLVTPEPTSPGRGGSKVTSFYPARVYPKV